MNKICLNQKQLNTSDPLHRRHQGFNCDSFSGGLAAKKAGASSQRKPEGGDPHSEEAATPHKHLWCCHQQAAQSAEAGAIHLPQGYEQEKVSGGEGRAVIYQKSAGYATGSCD